jgi:hypothetical protein
VIILVPFFKIIPVPFVQVVPIPMVTRLCNKKCCKVSFCPLVPSFARTLHTFQGQSSGPVDTNQAPNAVDRIIVDPGDKQFEGLNPGLFYMSLARATSIGTGNLDSAIYFTGPHMRPQRVLNLKLKKDGEEYKKVQLRTEWVKHIEKNTVQLNYDTRTIKIITDWCLSERITQKKLDDFLSKRSWRKHLIRDINY